MNYLEFKRLALSDPYSKDENFIEHSKQNSDSLKFLNEVKKMDADLDQSLHVSLPSDLMARLQLNAEMSESEHSQIRTFFGQKYAIAASFIAALLVASLFFTSSWNLNKQINNDYQSLLAGVLEHMHHQPFTPVWDSQRANTTVNALLASYDGSMQLKYLENLQFGRICPMGQYRGLHATLETEDGQVNFAFIKGESIGDLLTTGYEGYVSRIKPVRGGNLVIFSKTTQSLEQADKALEEAMYWDI